MIAPRKGESKSAEKNGLDDFTVTHVFQTSSDTKSGTLLIICKDERVLCLVPTRHDKKTKVPAKLRT